jgi:hypothetical protein
MGDEIMRWMMVILGFVTSGCCLSTAEDLFCITLESNGVARVDAVVEVKLPTSLPLHLVETDRDGAVIDASVPYQVSESMGSGDVSLLTFIATGQTGKNQTRYYRLRQAENKPPVQRLVFRETTVEHEGQESFVIRTQQAIYYYHVQGAGFASLEDRDGHDWLSYNPGVGMESQRGSGGMYRGIPNMGHPEGYCHPGNLQSSSRIIEDGPVKISILSTSNDGKMECRWDVYPYYARMTVLKMRTPYWFLYEGTPGGMLDMESDFCVRADGTRTLVSEKWEGDIQSTVPGCEWLYFGDGERVLYLIHHTDDEAVDSYWPMNEEMTVFGFGRLGINKYMKSVPDQFTVGLFDSPDYNTVKQLVTAIHTPVKITCTPQ